MRPQAASRQEELERSEARRAAEDGILKLTAEWQERMARARQAQEAATALHEAEPAVAEEEPPAGKQADGDPAAIEALTTERDRLQAELETAREENGRLRSSNEELNAESGRRDDESRKLNDLIVRSRRTEEQWRQAYVESRKGRRPDDTPVSIDSVGEAVALAREAFPDRLLIKLKLALEREHAVREPCGGVRRARLARHRALRPKRPSYRRSLLRVDVQDEPARGIDREVPRMVRDAGRRRDLVSRRPHRQGNQPRPAAHHPDRIRARRGTQPRDRGVHRVAPAKPTVMKSRREVRDRSGPPAAARMGGRRVEPDCRRRGGPPYGGADRAGCLAADPARRADRAGAWPVTRDALRTTGSRALAQDRLRVRLPSCRDRTAAGTLNAAAARCGGWRGVA